MTARTKPRVLVADDHASFTLALKGLLEPDCELVGQAATVAELLAGAHEWHPDVAVVDLMLPESNGIDACIQLKAAFPSMGIVMLTAMDDPDVKQAALAAGASGFVPKHSAGLLLLDAIRAAWRNSVF